MLRKKGHGEDMTTVIIIRKASASYNKWILPARSNEMETIQVMSEEEEDSEHYVRAFSELGLQLSCRQGNTHSLSSFK